MDYLAKVREKDREFMELDHRWQVDSDMLYLKKYVMMDKDGKHAIPDVINATLNKPAILAANVISSLGSVKQQMSVESENSHVDTTTIEEIVTACMAMANFRNRQMMTPQLNPAADVHLCMRGGAARRILFRMEDGKLVPDATAWDRRYVRHQADGDGLEWASFATTRSRGDIENEYGVVIKETTATCLDVWDREHEEVWVGNRQVAEYSHPYGFTPVVLESVSLGYGDVLLDTGHSKNVGESIFFMIRDVVPQLNMLLSILETLNFLSIKRPMSFLSKEGSTATPPEYDEAIAPGAITAGDLGGGLTPINFGDATKAAQMIYAMIEKAVQEGGYTDIDIGNVQQPFSAVALVTMGESKDKVYLPRLAAKEYLNIDTAEMIIRQLKQIGGTLELGTPGHAVKYPMSKLDGEYTVDYKYFVKSPKIDVARIAMAQQAAMWYPRRYIYQEVLQVEDPKGLEEDWYSQMAEELDPNIRKHRTIMKLLSKAEEEKDENAAWEAMILASGMGMSIAQIQSGMTPQQAAPSQPALANNVPGGVPMLGAGGAGGATAPVGPANTIGQAPAMPQMGG